MMGDDGVVRDLQDCSPLFIIKDFPPVPPSNSVCHEKEWDLGGNVCPLEYLYLQINTNLLILLIFFAHLVLALRRQKSQGVHSNGGPLRETCEIVKDKIQEEKKYETNMDRYKEPFKEYNNQIFQFTSENLIEAKENFTYDEKDEDVSWLNREEIVLLNSELTLKERELKDIEVKLNEISTGTLDLLFRKIEDKSEEFEKIENLIRFFHEDPNILLQDISNENLNESMDELTEAIKHEQIIGDAIDNPTQTPHSNNQISHESLEPELVKEKENNHNELYLPKISDETKRLKLDEIDSYFSYETEDKFHSAERNLKPSIDPKTIKSPHESSIVEEKNAQSLHESSASESNSDYNLITSSTDASELSEMNNGSENEDVDEEAELLKLRRMKSIPLSKKPSKIPVLLKTSQRDFYKDSYKEPPKPKTIQAKMKEKKKEEKDEKPNAQDFNEVGEDSENDEEIFKLLEDEL